MKQKRLGRQTVVFEAPPRIAAGATIVGDMEGAGPLGGYFDLILEDDTWGEDTWEKAERKMFEQTVRRALERCAMQPAEIDLLLGGDLLNQIITANFAARELAIPFLGLYGACSTMAESLLLGSMLIDGAIGAVAGAAGGNGASYGNAKSINQAGKQLLKRGLLNPQARAYYAKVAHNAAKEYVFAPLLKSLGYGTIGKAVSAFANWAESRWLKA